MLIIQIIINASSFPFNAFDQSIFVAESAHCYVCDNLNVIVRIIINIDHNTGYFCIIPYSSHFACTNYNSFRGVSIILIVFNLN